MRTAIIVRIGLAAAAAVSLMAQDRPIDAARSTITVHVGKSGLFSAAGHEHWVNAPIASGTLNDADRPRIEFTVRAASLEVKPDPKVDAKTQAEIQKTMQETALESARYPEIAFRSAKAERQAGGGWRVEGTLTLHGASRPVAATVTRSGDAYSGRVTIKQTDFGMRPISVAGGVVKVKNELDIEFSIAARAQ